MWTFRIDGETPPKKNSRRVFTAGGKMAILPSAAHEAWHGRAARSLMAQRRPPRPIESGRLEARFVHGDLRRRDADNALSSILDLLVDCGIIADDSWRMFGDIHVLNSYEKGKAECVVSIFEKGD